MTTLNQTKAQLEALGNPRIGIECRDGTKIFGRPTKFTQFKIYLKTKHGDILDVPRRIIRRAFLLIDGGIEDNDPAELSKTNKSPSGGHARKEN